MNPQKALTIAFVLSLAILLIELTGGFVFNSSALVADGLHIVTDVLAILFSLVALNLALRPPSDYFTYGYHRLEVVASLVNGISLFGIVVVIFFEAYQKILSPVPISVLGTMGFAAIALCINVVSSTIVRKSAKARFREGREDENLSSAHMHILGDAVSSLAVIAGAIAVYLTGNEIIDPIVAMFIGLIVLRSAYVIMKKGTAIILERSPIKDMDGLKNKLTSVQGVSDIHDFHVWRIDSQITVATMHACLVPEAKDKATEVRKALENDLSESGVQHVTIQLEEVCCVPSHGHQGSSMKEQDLRATHDP